MTDNTIEFRTTHNEAPKWVMKITADRRIEVNEDVEVTEAAKKVLEAMQYLLAQQRTWVGLTDEDWEPLYDKFAKHQEYGAFVSGWDKFARAIEAKLRSKNENR